MLTLPRRRVPPPQPVTSQGASTNPLFESNDPRQLQRFRRVVLLSLAAVLAVLGLGLSLYGPWLTLTTIEVSGTRKLNPASVRQSAERYAAGRRWLILPKNNTWVISANGLAQHLEEKISERLSIEGVTVTKRYPHTVSIVVAERTPIAAWHNGTLWGSIDRQGTIVESIAAPIDPTAELIVIDDTQAAFTVGQKVIDQSVIKFITSLTDRLKQSNLAVSAVHIPVPSCPLPIPVPTNTNANLTNSSDTANDNVNTNTTKLINASTTNGNSNQSGTEPLPDCDLAALKLSSLEVHVKLADGPMVYFDRHQDVANAVQALQRVITENKAQGATYIDVRFPDRVYIK